MTNAGITKHTRAARAAVVNSIADQAKISPRTVRRLMTKWRTINSSCGCGQSPAQYNSIVHRGSFFDAYSTVCERCC